MLMIVIAFTFKPHYKNPMDYQDIFSFCESVVRKEMLPVLQENYALLCAQSRKHGGEFFTNSGAAASFKTNGKGLVSLGEIEAERLLRQRFSNAYPAFRIYGEELGDEEIEAEYTLVIDPVDGTSSMIESIINPVEKHGFGITLGFLEGENFAAGMVFELQTDGDNLEIGRIFTAQQGQGAYRDGQKIEVKQSGIAHTLYCTAPEVMFKTPVFNQLITHFPRVKTKQNCIGFMDAILQDGACVMETDLSIHDIAALVPILKEAGVRTSDLDGEPLTYAGAEKEYQILAAPDMLHEKALQAYKSALKNAPDGHEKSDTPTLNTKKFQD